eukprot:Partr_v1_DN22258_c0_g1_i2_m59385 putative Kv channel interacting protein
MGHARSKSAQAVDRRGAAPEAELHLNRSEVLKLTEEFQRIAHNNDTITKDQFKEILTNHVQFWAAGNMFLERLFDAFDVDGSHSIDLNEFIKGFDVFIKGTPDEKLALTFKFYDLDGDGNVTQKEVAKVLTELYSAFYKEDRSEEILSMTRRWFEDLDVNGDGTLSFEEFKLSALKEPMVVNFLEQFVQEKSQPS